MIRRFVCWVALAFSAFAAEPLTPDQKRLNVESFERVWTMVRDTHWDPKLGGLDWKGGHDELRPSIEKAENMAQARQVMRDMLARLRDSHFNIIPLDVYDEVDEASGATAGEGRTGITVRVVNGEALVTAVEPDSPAAKAGVK